MTDIVITLHMTKVIDLVKPEQMKGQFEIMFGQIMKENPQMKLLISKYEVEVRE